MATIEAGTCITVTVVGSLPVSLAVLSSPPPETVATLVMFAGPLTGDLIDAAHTREEVDAISNGRRATRGLARAYQQHADIVREIRAVAVEVQRELVDGAGKIIVTNSLFMKFDPVLANSYADGWLLKLSIAAIAAFMSRAY